jgi:hypothetical protein
VRAQAKPIPSCLCAGVDLAQGAATRVRKRDRYGLACMRAGVSVSGQNGVSLVASAVSFAFIGLICLYSRSLLPLGGSPLRSAPSPPVYHASHCLSLSRAPAAAPSLSLISYLDHSTQAPIKQHKHQVPCGRQEQAHVRTVVKTVVKTHEPSTMSATGASTCIREMLLTFAGPPPSCRTCA